MGKLSRHHESARKVPYASHLPRTQSKPLGPLLRFKANLENAVKRAIPGLQSRDRWKVSQKCQQNKTHVEHLMNLFAFDLNQLSIYENQTKKDCKKDGLEQLLSELKFKVDKVKKLSKNNSCLYKAEEMLARRARLKCASRSLRRQLICFMANVCQSELRSRLICELMKHLDRIDTEIAELCRPVKDTQIAVSCTGVDKKRSCQKLRCSKSSEINRPALPAICEEVLRPYDPATDSDADSIHLRYIPQLDSFKADMARNPCALRLPLMCPAMKRIMNKMKPKYLMDDVPLLLFHQSDC